MQNAGGIYTSTYDELGRISTVKNPAAKTITYNYDANSNRTQMIDPDGGRFTYAYDNRGLLDVLVNPQSDRTTFSYDANGQRTLKKLANGTRASQTYDPVGNLEKLYNFKSNNSVISSFDYSNNAVNNRTNVVESNGDRVTWSYDNTSQLLSEHRSGANSYAHTFSYDETGNRRTKKVDGVNSTYIYDAANQLKTCEGSGGSATFLFDNNGNQRTEQSPGGAVTTNTWDYENHLTIIEQPAVNNITYSYNPDGLRVEKDNQGTITKFVWDDQAYLAETDSGDTTTVVYSNEPSTFGDLISQRRTSNSSFFHFDALGSTRELTASDESITDTLIYDAWGEEIGRTGATDVNFQFVGIQGYYHDSESNSFYIRARHYNPNLGSWMSKDPLGTLDGMNMYLYVSNNPVEFTDPTGHQKGPFTFDPNAPGGFTPFFPAPKPNCKAGDGFIWQQGNPACEAACETATTEERTGGGSIFCTCKKNCEGVITCDKCVCAFDRKGIFYSKCPSLAKCGCIHEVGHLCDVGDCPTDKEGSFKHPDVFSPKDIIRLECPLRKADVKCIEKAKENFPIDGKCLKSANAWLDIIEPWIKKKCP